MKNLTIQAWRNVVAPIPGLPLKQRRRYLFIGGLFFWVFYLFIMLFVYYCVFAYALAVLTFRVAVAVLVTLAWGIDEGMKKIRRRGTLTPSAVDPSASGSSS